MSFDTSRTSSGRKRTPSAIVRQVQLDENELETNETETSNGQKKRKSHPANATQKAKRQKAQGKRSSKKYDPDEPEEVAARRFIAAMERGSDSESESGSRAYDHDDADGDGNAYAYGDDDDGGVGEGGELNEVPDEGEWPTGLEDGDGSEEESMAEDEDLLAHLPSIGASIRSRSLPPSCVILVLFQRISLQRTEYWTFPYGHLTNSIVRTLCTLNGYGLNSRESLSELDTLWGSREDEHIGWREVAVPIPQSWQPLAKQELIRATVAAGSVNGGRPTPSEQVREMVGQLPSNTDLAVEAAIVPAAASQQNDAPVPGMSDAAASGSETAGGTSVTLASSVPTVPVLGKRRVYCGRHIDWQRISALQFDQEHPSHLHEPVNLMAHVAMAFQITFQ